MKTGLGILLNTVSQILGQRVTAEVAATVKDAAESVAGYEDLVDMHAFRIKPGSNLVMFDVIATFDVEDDEALCEQVAREAEAEFPAYRFLVTADSDVAGD